MQKKIGKLEKQEKNWKLENEQNVEKIGKLEKLEKKFEIGK